MMHIEETNGIILDNTKNVGADSHPASKKVENACEPTSPFTVGFVHAKRKSFRGFFYVLSFERDEYYIGLLK